MASPKIYESVGRLFSRRRIRALGGFLDAAGMNIDPESFAGFFVVLTLLMMALATLLSLQVGFTRDYVYKMVYAVSPGAAGANFQMLALAIALAIFATLTLIVMIMLVYVILLLRIEDRKAKLEDVLPDFLTLAAANVRAGMNVDQALWYSSKPEFGLLSAEVELVAKRTLGGEPFNQALDRLASRFNSKILNRTIALIKQGMASGGQIAEIMERTAEDARNIKMIRKEIGASLVMYIIFIVFASCLGTPFLFAVSNRLISMLSSVFMQLPTMDQMPAIGFLKPSPPSITSGDFFLFTIAATVTTALFSSLIIGVIQRGEKKNGLKYIPFLIAGSIGMFLLISEFLSSFLKNIAV